jgi:2',3'-cyclic-nucleotide 2'-phosphodiesterase (5'-nucleotidase family)
VRIYTNGTKEYVNATLANGSKIDPKATYRGVSTGYLMKGGARFANVMGKVYTLRN